MNLIVGFLDFMCCLYKGLPHTDHMTGQYKAFNYIPAYHIGKYMNISQSFVCIFMHVCGTHNQFLLSSEYCVSPNLEI